MFRSSAGTATSYGLVLICREQACIMPSVVEVSGKQVASTFSHSWSERWLLDTKLDSTAFFGGISSQAALLVSENKPQILLKCLHVWICVMQTFQF